MIWVESAEHAGEYRLKLRFNDGTEGTVDLRDVVCHDPRPVFRQASDPEVFRRFKVDRDTVVWEHGQLVGRCEHQDLSIGILWSWGKVLAACLSAGRRHLP